MAVRRTIEAMSSEEAAWLATLRPSRIRDVQAGALAWTSLDLVDVESGHGALTRPILESFGVRVNLFRVGQARHLVAALGGEAAAPYVLLACHGDGGRIVLPELAEELERFQPFRGRCGPDDLRAFARLAGNTVIATGCEMGGPQTGRGVLRRGRLGLRRARRGAVRLRQPVRSDFPVLRTG